MDTNHLKRLRDRAADVLRAAKAAKQAGTVEAVAAMPGDAGSKPVDV